MWFSPRMTCIDDRRHHQTWKNDFLNLVSQIKISFPEHKKICVFPSCRRFCACLCAKELGRHPVEASLTGPEPVKTFSKWESLLFSANMRNTDFKIEVHLRSYKIQFFFGIRECGSIQICPVMWLPFPPGFTVSSPWTSGRLLDPCVKLHFWSIWRWKMVTQLLFLSSKIGIPHTRMPNCLPMKIHTPSL